MRKLKDLKNKPVHKIVLTANAIRIYNILSLIWQDALVCIGVLLLRTNSIRTKGARGLNTLVDGSKKHNPKNQKKPKKDRRKEKKWKKERQQNKYKSEVLNRNDIKRYYN